MKHKIKIVKIDECVEDVEFFVDFLFLDSKIRYNAELFFVRSKILYSLLDQEITVDLVLKNTRCKQNKEKKYTWLNSKLNSDIEDTWLDPADIEETKELSCAYLCSGKILDIVRDEFDCEYYRLQSAHNIDVDTDLFNHLEKDDIKPEDIKIGEYYSFRGALTIITIDEIEELYKSRL